MYLALIVEDAPEMATIFAEILQMAGLATEVISNGQLAIAKLKEIVPAVVILDMHLPHVSGMDILKSIRADSRLALTKVIAVTADVLLIQDLEDLADLTLIKPVTFDQLSDLTTRLLPTQTSTESQ
ncbi:MAG: response regulator [Chloroflexota bacterium]